MAIAKAVDIESVRFAAPELAKMRQFLLDFGMTDAVEARDGILRMRGAGDAPFVHETVQGPAGFIGLTLRLDSLEDLKRLADAEEVSVEPCMGPGGGEQIILKDPDGYSVKVIAGKKRVPIAARPTRTSWNVPSARERRGTVKRIPAGPATVVRLGHVVLGVSNMETTWDWWQSRLGLLVSDEVRGPNDQVAALFVRCDRGGELADHHTLNFASVPGLPPRFHHAAFEVLDLDDLMAGSQFLVTRGYRHDWGVGRHVLGSQVFDYWRDPFGHRIEHWTDGDFLDASAPPNITDIATMLGHQWGPAAPPDFAT